MSIDWITVAAQLVNFLLLVWLLKKFLYQPILKGIAAREAEIASRLDTAAQAKEEADAVKANYQELIAQSLANQEAKLAEALAATQAERDRLLSQARQRLVKEQASWQEQLAEEKQIFLRQLEASSAQTLFKLMHKAINDLAGLELETAIAQQLISKMQPLAAEIRHSAAGNKQVLINSQTPLASVTQANLTLAMQQILPQAEVEFNSSTDNALGIQLQVGGVQLAWTLDSYLEDLSQLLTDNTAHLLQEKQPHA